MPAGPPIYENFTGNFIAEPVLDDKDKHKEEIAIEGLPEMSQRSPKNEETNNNQI